MPDCPTLTQFFKYLPSVQEVLIKLSREKSAEVCAGLEEDVFSALEGDWRHFQNWQKSYFSTYLFDFIILSLAVEFLEMQCFREIYCYIPTEYGEPKNKT